MSVSCQSFAEDAFEGLCAGLTDSLYEAAPATTRTVSSMKLQNGF